MHSQKKFSILGTSANLEGIAHLPDAALRAIAVVAHPLSIMGGTMDNKVVTTFAKTFMELGFVALRFNFRGAGARSGEFDSATVRWGICWDTSHSWQVAASEGRTCTCETKQILLHTAYTEEGSTIR